MDFSLSGLIRESRNQIDIQLKGLWPKQQANRNWANFSDPNRSDCSGQPQRTEGVPSYFGGAGEGRTKVPGIRAHVYLQTLIESSQVVWLSADARTHMCAHARTSFAAVLLSLRPSCRRAGGTWPLICHPGETGCWTKVRKCPEKNEMEGRKALIIINGGGQGGGQKFRVFRHNKNLVVTRALVLFGGYADV